MFTWCWEVGVSSSACVAYFMRRKIRNHYIFRLIRNSYVHSECHVFDACFHSATFSIYRDFHGIGPFASWRRKKLYHFTRSCLQCTGKHNITLHELALNKQNSLILMSKRGIYGRLTIDFNQFPFHNNIPFD